MPENPSRVTGVRQSPRSVHHASVTYTVLYSFRGYPYDGAGPAGLTYFNGTFYGTTYEGGVYLCPDTGSPDGCGTVYSITPSGTETVLHSFKGGKDGASPVSRLIVRNGTFYGVTAARGGGCRQDRGTYGCGTVFSITPSGHETVLHAFTDSPDGASPRAALRNVNGTLYGTTPFGGVNCNKGYCGTVFSITPDGKEKVLYSFGAYANDARYPWTPLDDVKGTLYGTSFFGGAHNNGTVFSITPGGKEKVLHSFGIPDDPSGLVDVSGTLYGTTYSGGSCYTGGGCGTVFSITTSGAEKVLHSFSGGDGAFPDAAALLNVKGTLYGTTAGGGAYRNGTVFSITPSGHETVLYSFKGGQDGSPSSGLSYINGTFYGTTGGGGAYNDGTVYSITP
jgi:uncharacterized repeat protein (TIGR03803 family)